MRLMLLLLLLGLLGKEKYNCPKKISSSSTPVCVGILRKLLVPEREKKNKTMINSPH